MNSLTGWGLNNPDKNIFSLEDTGEEMGHCMSETCAHYSHDPLGPVNRLVLKDGLMESVRSDSEPATDDRDPPNAIDYYSLPNGNFLKIVTPFHFEARASIVDALPEPGREEEYQERRQERRQESEIRQEIRRQRPIRPRPERPLRKR